MNNDIELESPSLKSLFPKLSEKELKAVGEVFHGYLEIAWRIFERIEAEKAQKDQEKQDQPEFECP